MMETGLTREEALQALQTYNHEPFHLQHALTVEDVMGWFAKEEGFEAESDFWRMAGLLHDIDFEQWPEQHCVKCIELLQSAHATPELIHAICCHGYGICTDVEPTLPMEKILFAADELTGLIGAATKMRPSKSCTDMELSSLKRSSRTRNSRQDARATSSARARNALAGRSMSCLKRRCTRWQTPKAPSRKS